MSARSAPPDHPFPVVVAGLARADEVDTVAQEATRLLGVDVLVSNVGGQVRRPRALDFTDDDWYADLNINVLAAVRLDRILAPAMVAQRSGVIIHVSSGAARIESPAAAADGALLNRLGQPGQRPSLPIRFTSSKSTGRLSLPSVGHENDSRDQALDDAIRGQAGDRLRAVQHDVFFINHPVAHRQPATDLYSQLRELAEPFTVLGGDGIDAIQGDGSIRLPHLRIARIARYERVEVMTVVGLNLSGDDLNGRHAADPMRQV